MTPFSPKGGGSLDRYRLKNIIIIILLLVNGFLLGMLSMRQTSVNDSHRQTAVRCIDSNPPKSNVCRITPRSWLSGLSNSTQLEAGNEVNSA